MPNWCEGSLKLRSKNKENIIKFIKESFIDCHYGDNVDALIEKPGIETGAVEIDIYDDESVLITLDVDKSHWIWLKDCGRSFIETDKHTWYDILARYDNYICSFDFKTAWSIDPNDWINISRKYNMDIRLYGIEKGMEFTQEVEIIDGKVMYNNVKNYSDWEWECPFPKMGG